MMCFVSVFLSGEGLHLLNDDIEIVCAIFRAKVSAVSAFESFLIMAKIAAAFRVDVVRSRERHGEPSFADAGRAE
jgi:hypothetical protein